MEVEMVGRSGGTPGARERIAIVDALLAGRLKRAARRYVLGRPQVWRAALATSIAVVLCIIAPNLTAPQPRALLALALAAPGAIVVGTAVMLGYQAWHVGRHYDREFVPGRLVGLTIGSQTIRFRDHDSCTEYAYSCVTGVEARGDVVVIELGKQFWALPMELFDGVALEVLRARAGRPALGNELWPELTVGADGRS
jgi:hypothetical protein